MKRYLIVALLFVMSGVCAQQVSPDADAENANAAEASPSAEMLRQAFDGAMTCSAVAAITADKAGPDVRWKWENRSFAFGMLAARFWHEASGEPITAEAMDKVLNQYAGTMLEMVPHAYIEFETSCAGKLADIDQLCEVNTCVHDGPPDAAQAQEAAP